MCVMNSRGIVRFKQFRKWWGDMEKWIIVWAGEQGVIRLRNVYDDGTLDMSKHQRAFAHVFQTKISAHMVAVRLAKQYAVSYDISWKGIHGDILELM